MMLLGSLTLGCSRPLVQVAHAGSPQGLVVTGHGEVSAKPDIARVSLGVDVRAATVALAMEQANNRMQSLISVLKANGIEDKDLQTSQFNVHFERERRNTPVLEGPVSSQPKSPSQAGLYRVHNSLKVTVRRLASLGLLLDSAFKAGANESWGIQWDIDDAKALEQDAKHLAIDDAKMQAAQMAKSAGVDLGNIVAIHESSHGYPVPRMEMARSMSSDAVQVQSGELKIQKQVTLQYNIDR